MATRKLDAHTGPDHPADHILWQQDVAFMPRQERITLAYRRARWMLNRHQISIDDVRDCTDKFWAYQADPLFPHDVAAFTISAAHLNLAVGTLVKYLPERPELKPLVQSLLSLDTVGLYLLTERGHGLDAFNIETTASKTKEGYTLNTPREQAMKFMPASTANGWKKVAVVVAKLLIDGKSKGSRSFLVPITDGKQMYRGVTSYELPPRPGTTPLDFSLTHFDQVHLPNSALLGHEDLSVVTRVEWWSEISRIPIGTFGVALPFLQGLKQTSIIAGRYSLHRRVGVPKGSGTIPIISFATQQIPILEAIAAAHVLDAWRPDQVKLIQNLAVPFELRHAAATIFKTTVVRTVLRFTPLLSERCGAQGTLEPNMMQRFEIDTRGCVIAEGDILALCIRLFSQILQKQYRVDLPDASTSPLAHRAIDLLDRYASLIRDLQTGHRGDEFNELILPHAEETISAIGHALAYDSAIRLGLDQKLRDLYVSSIMRLDPSWFLTKGGFTSSEDIDRFQARALRQALPDLERYLNEFNMDRYVKSPLVKEDGWGKYYPRLPKFTGNAIAKL